MPNTAASVLIVDDEGSVRDILFRLLSQASYRCVAAATAEEALAQLARHTIEVALLDLLMPGMSGMDLLREIKRHWPDTAVIMITAMAETETAVDAMRQGAHDYIIKPFSMGRVLLSVERALEVRRLTLENRRYQLHLEEQVREQAAKLRQTFMGSIEALVRAMEAKDHYTRGHTERVMDLAVITARELELTETEVEQVRLGGLLHDIGKIGVREAVLLKPGPLTSAEYAHLSHHVTVGEYILRSVVEDPEVHRIVRAHHERFDGSGVPDGLKGEAIPLGARILSVVDAFEAMISNRPYRPPRSRSEARDELLRCSGTQFDPAVVAAFLRALNRDDLAAGPAIEEPPLGDRAPWRELPTWR